jgi:peptidoglycan-associated lipoprotein
MRKKLWVGLALLLVLPSFLFTASCAKKAVDQKPAVAAEDDAAAKAAAEKARQEELARQKALEEQRLREERERQAKEAMMNQFVYEDVYFDFDSSVIKSSAQAILKRKADYLRANPGAKVIIEGHCDERGTPEYNLALGDRRAQAAKKFLVDLGVDGASLTTISYGEERPVDPAQNEEAWAKNRRAHFVLE